MSRPPSIITGSFLGVLIIIYSEHEKVLSAYSGLSAPWNTSMSASASRAVAYNLGVGAVTGYLV